MSVEAPVRPEVRRYAAVLPEGVESVFDRGTLSLYAAMESLGARYDFDRHFTLHNVKVEAEILTIQGVRHTDQVRGFSLSNAGLRLGQDDKGRPTEVDIIFPKRPTARYCCSCHNYYRKWDSRKDDFTCLKS